MASFEKIIEGLEQGFPDYEIDKKFLAVLAYAQSINEFYRNRGVPVNYDEALVDLEKLNDGWSQLQSDENVSVNGVIILNDDPDSDAEINHSSDEYAIELNHYELRSTKFVLRDTLKFEGQTVVSGTQEIMLAGLVDLADLLLDEQDDGDELGDDEYEGDEDQQTDYRNRGVVWGLVSIGQIEPRFIAVDPEITIAEAQLSERCIRHFEKVRAIFTSSDTTDASAQLHILSDLEQIPEHSETAIAVYREILEKYLNDKMVIDENIPHVIRTNGEYMRNINGKDSGEYAPSEEDPQPNNIAVVKVKFCVGYDEVGLAAICIRASNLLADDADLPLLSIPLRSVISIESTEEMIRSKLDAQPE